MKEGTALKKISILIVSFIALCSLSSCSGSSPASSSSAPDVTSSESSEASVTQSQTVSETKQTEPVAEVDQKTADERAKAIFEAAQQTADKYETAGAEFNAAIITSADISGDNAEKQNFLNFMTPLVDFGGNWAVSIDHFKIVSAVYAVSPDTSVLGKYPESFSGTLDDSKVGSNLTVYLK